MSFKAYKVQKALVEKQIEEIQSFQSMARTPGVGDLLARLADDLCSQLKDAEPEYVYKNVVQSMHSVFDTKDAYIVTVMIGHVEAENIVSDFQPTSIDIKVHDAKNDKSEIVHYRYKVPRLYREIIPQLSRVDVDTKKIDIILVKVTQEEVWPNFLEPVVIGGKRRRG